MKATADRASIVVVVVNLDPHGVHGGDVILPLHDWGVAPDQEFSVERRLPVVSIPGAVIANILSSDPQDHPALLFRLLLSRRSPMTPPDDAPTGLLTGAPRLRALPDEDNDPLWYKDAIIYQLHVKAFFDANNDGVGDFEGLTRRLDYLQDLGVTALWLLPFYPSPLRDDGYDIAEYKDIHSSYGRMTDFKRSCGRLTAGDCASSPNWSSITPPISMPGFSGRENAKPGSALRDF